MSREIALTSGQVALVDDADYKLLNMFKWRVGRPRSSTGYYAKRRSKRDKNGKRYWIWMAREILGAKPTQQVDHISGDSLDNRRANLRLCTNAENARNQRPIRGGSSRFKGVSWEERRGMWRAKIGYEGRKIFLGYFHDEGEAALAYNKAAARLFGRFARPNIIPQDEIGLFE